MKNLLLFLFIGSIAFAGNDKNPVGNIAGGMGNQGLFQNNVWGVLYNPGALGNFEGTEVGISYENRFGISALGIGGAGFAHKVGKGAVGLVYNGFGDKLYRESNISLGYGLGLSDKVSLGATINYHNTVLGNNYGSLNYFTFSIGGIAQLSKAISIAVNVFNPSQTKLQDFAAEKVPTLIDLGLQYTFSDKVLIATSIEKDIDFDPSFKMGVEYKPMDNIYVRAGFYTGPSTPTFGVGINMGTCVLDLSYRNRNQIGNTIGLGIRFVQK